MPYKDKEKQAAAVKAAKEKAREKAEEQAQEAQGIEKAFQDSIKDQDTVVTQEQVEAVYDMDEGETKQTLEASITKKLRYVSGATWAFIMYTDSCPADWEHDLRMAGHIAAVSPLHDSDVDKNGNPKKPHYHVIITRENGGKYTFNTACQVSRGICHGTIPIPLASPRGYYRYFTHLDNPEKAQYSVKDIVHINGFDPESFLDLTKKEKLEMLKRLTELAVTMDFVEYNDLVLYVMYNESDAAFDLVTHNTLYFDRFLRGQWRTRNRAGSQG